MENELTLEVIGELTEADLKELGLPMGVRKLFLKRVREGANEVNSPSSDQTLSTPSTEASAGRSERRQLTVMFLDIVGSTALSESLDPEEYRSTILAYQSMMVKAIQSFEGYVAKYLGDGLMVYFGYPVAFEDSAERSLRAGIEIIRQIPEVAQHQSHLLQIRIGVATGLVIAGDIDIDGTSDIRSVLGDTPNLAARLQSFAQENTLIICETTRRLVEGQFELTDKGSHTLKGISKPVAIFEVLDVSQASSRFDLIHGGNIRDMVGRDHEIGLMGERWRQACEEDGQAILLSGDAGIGKSRIVRALQETAYATSATRIILQCISFQSNSPLQPFIEYLLLAAGADNTAPAAENIEGLKNFLNELGDYDPESVELFSALLNFETNESQALLSHITPEQRKQRVHQLIIATVLRLSKRDCVLLVFEDAHWADASSLELMEKMIAAAEHQALLVVITFRPEFKAPWSSYSHLSSLPLSKISRSSIRRIIEGIVKGKELPNVVVDQIIQKTDGIPLFIEELTRMIIESDLLVEKEDRYVLQGELKNLEIPSTLQASLLARLDRLQSARQIAQTAAAIGRQFEQQLLLHVMQIEPVLLQQALQQLVDAEMIFRSGSDDNHQYIFKHALIQDAAYESLLKSERQNIHRRIADVMEQQFQISVENRPEILAYHVTRAEQIERALPLWLKASKVSMQKFFHIESRNHLDTGLSLLMANPKVEGFDVWELRYQAMLGQVWWVVRGYASPEAGKAYARARELCRTVNLPELVGPVLAGLWMFLVVGGQHRQAAVVSDEFIAGITENSDKNTQCASRYTAALSQYAMGSPKTSRDQLIQCINTANPDPEDRTLIQDYGGDIRLTGKCYLSWIYLSLGEIDLAEEEVQRALSFSEKLNVPTYKTRADWILSMYYAMKGDWVNAETTAK